MEVEIISENSIVLIRPEGQLEEFGEFKDKLEELMSSGYQHFLLDLFHLDWVTSKEIGSILWIFKNLEETGSKLYLLTDSKLILKTIKTTGIDELLTIFKSKTEALESLTS